MESVEVKAPDHNGKEFEEQNGPEPNPCTKKGETIPDKKGKLSDESCKPAQQTGKSNPNRIAKLDQKMKNSKPQPSKKGKPGFNEDMFQETSYYFKDGLRWVFPYTFTFTAFAKQRWFDLTVLELFSKEFHLETVDYYKRAIASGKILVNGQPVTPEQKLKNQDILKTMIHRHEPPVAHQDIEFLRNDEEMVVINKPPSIPVHPCGRYRHNSIVFILGKEHNLHGLHTIHRLDRLTSGVLMFSKTVSKAKEIEDQLHRKQCIEKEYLARVVGEFPEDEIVVDKPVATASHKIGVCHVHANGKPCSTRFKRLSFNGKSSVVSCKPHQGRMHQIRVHLQWLGHPIVNDPIYNHPTAWETNKRKNDIDEVILELIRTRKDKSYDDELSTDKPDTGPNRKKRKLDNEGGVQVKKEDVDVSKEGKHIDKTVENNCNELHSNSNLIENGDMADSTDCKTTNDCTVISNMLSVKPEPTEVDDGRLSYTSLDIGEQYVDSDCSDCKRTWKQPLISEMVMYLHSLHYKGPGWEYKTTVPEWANEDWVKD